MLASLKSELHRKLANGLALVFDMDGVLIDSNPLHREAWTVFNRQYGIDTTEAMLQRMYGKRNDEIVRDFFGASLAPEEITARGARKEELYREMAGQRIDSLLVAGVKSFLDEYREAPMALASNAERANVRFVLDRAGLREYFRVVVDGEQVSQPKPHPEVYLRAADLLGVPPPNCLVFEDSLAGVEAARAAGARVIGVLTTHENLPGVDLAIDNFWSTDLEPWLQGQKPV